MMNARQLLLTTVLLLAASPGVRAQWTQTSGPEGGYVRTMAVHDGQVYTELWNSWFHRHDGSSWNRGSVIVASRLFATDSSILANTLSRGPHRSTDGGETWDHIDSSGPARILAVENEMVYGSRNDTLMKSSDGGASWEVAGVTPAGPLFDVLGVTGDTLVAGNTTTSLSFRSTDGGENWTSVTISSGVSISPRGFVADGTRFYALSPLQGIFRSTDAGASWHPLNDGLPEDGGIYPYIASLGAAGDTLWASTTTQIFRFDGNRWEEMPAGVLENGRFASDNGILYCGSNAGIFRSADAGRTWNSMNSGLIATSVTALQTAGNGMIANQTNGIHRTSDGGATWNRVADLNVAQFVSAGNRIYARTQNYTGRGIQRSTDNGLSWSPSNNGISGEDLPYLSVMAAGDQVVIAGLYDIFGQGSTHWQHGGFYRSTDGGESWMAANTGLPNDGHSTVPVASIATDGSIFVAATVAGVYRSVDGGLSWSPSATGLPSELASIGYPGHADGVFYITVDRTIYRSTDGGATWAPFGNGLPSTIIVNSFSTIGRDIVAFASSSEAPYERMYLLKGTEWHDLTASIPEDVEFTTVAAAGTTLFAGSSGDGVWKAPIDIVASAPDETGGIAGGVALHGAQPNPFNGTTAIRFSLREQAHVHASVIDPAGREIALLADGIMEGGEGTLAFNAEGLPSGVYFVRLNAGGTVRTARILLTR